MDTWELLAIVVVTVMYGILGVQLLYVFKITPRRYRNAKKRFFQELNTRWKLGFIKNTDDITSLRRAVARREKSARLESREISDLLDEYSLEITSAKVEKIDKEKLGFVKGLLDQQAIEEPFSVLPDKERALAVALRNSIEDEKKDDALQQLNGLVESVGTRLNTAEEEVNKNRMWTRASVFVGIGAVIITIILFLVLH